jgi:hypothetical protein
VDGAGTHVDDSRVDPRGGERWLDVAREYGFEKEELSYVGEEG